MKHFAKSILNYFATFNETRFRFGTKRLAYQKDLKDGEVALKGANSKTALIAVDKHGNESQIVTVKG